MDTSSHKKSPLRSPQKKAPRSSHATKTEAKSLATAHDNLKRAFDALRISPRFEMFKSLSAAGLVSSAGKPPPAFKTFSLEDLLALGADEVCRLRGVKSRHIQTLALATRSMAEDIPSENFEAPGIMPAACGLFDSGDPLLPPVSKLITSDLPTFSSTEAELKLIELLKELRAEPAAKKFHSRPLGEFWKAGWPKAPFEEQLTIRQILDADVEALLKKRSFTAQKLSAFIKALESIFEKIRNEGKTATQGKLLTARDISRDSDKDATPRMQPHTATPSMRPHTATPSMRPHTATPSMRPHTMDLSGSGRALDKLLIWGLEESLLQLPADHPIAVGYNPLGELFEASQAVSFIASLEDLHSRPCNSSDVTALAKIFAPALTLMGKRVRSALPAFASSTEVALTSSGVALANLWEPYQVVTHESALQQILFQGLLLSLGAKPIAYKGVAVPGYWTRSSSTFERLFASLVSALPQSWNKIETEATELLPLFDLKTLRTLLSHFAAPDSSGVWKTNK